MTAIADDIAKLKEEISQCNPESIYNMDETGLNYRLLPRKMYAHRTEKNVRGTKSMKSKDRVMLYVATNATGTQSAIITDCIGSSENPRCFGQNEAKREIKYFNQKKAWSDTGTFTKWCNEVFLLHIRSKTREKIY